MDKIELREQIARQLYSIMGWRQDWDNLEEQHKDYWGIKSNQILKLIEQAGYLPVGEAQLEVLGEEELDKGSLTEEVVMQF